MKDLNQILMEEIARMDRREKSKIKLSYSNGDMEEEYGIDNEKYEKLSNNLDAPYKA